MTCPHLSWLASLSTVFSLWNLFPLTHSDDPYTPRLACICGLCQADSHGEFTSLPAEMDVSLRCSSNASSFRKSFKVLLFSVGSQFPVPQWNHKCSIFTFFKFFLHKSKCIESFSLGACKTPECLCFACSRNLVQTYLILLLQRGGHPEGKMLVS